jgi:PAS domain S-box-containing protein
MTRSNFIRRFRPWLKHPIADVRFLHRLDIRRRLTLCFIAVIALMLVGNGVVLWQLHLIRDQVEHLNGVNDELIEVLRVHTGLLSAYERLGVLARSEDSALFLKESSTLRADLLNDARRTQIVFDHLPPEVKVDQTVVATLESIELTLPSHLDAITAAAANGEWGAVRFRIERQVQPLESLSSELVKDVANEVSEQRAQAALSISRAQRNMFLAVPVTGLLTLLIAAGLGAVVTSSITEPLGRLVEGSRALARGEFQHRVHVSGKDELAQLSGVFNEATEKLGDLYETLRSREAYLAEAQRLSHSGTWAWRVGSDHIYWSDEAFRIYGVDRGTTPTKELLRRRIHPDDFEAVKAVDGMLFSGSDADLRYRIVLSDGSIKHVRSVAHSVVNESGRVTEFVGTVIDVTEQHSAHQALERAFEEIQVLRDRLFKENIALREEVDKTSMFEEIVGNSGALRAVLARVAKVAPTDSTILITGETGTGKELVARAIHKRSLRSARAFVNVNCAAIPTSLIASELFGHEKGAFTGALQRRLGRFELADGGTIFLDEIGELPLDSQISLLRVLQEREIERLGGNKSITIDVRVIAATNRDLHAAIAASTFRSDLFYRLNVVPLEVPPLRDRKEDVPVLIEYFVDRFARRAGKKIRIVEKRTLELLKSYSWPGNIRELQNIIERSVVICESEVLSVEESWLSIAPSAGPPQTIDRTFGKPDPTQERKIIEETLAQTRGRVSGPLGAAARLGLPASTLESKIRALGIDKYRFKAPEWASDSSRIS